MSEDYVRFKFESFKRRVVEWYLVSYCEPLKTKKIRDMLNVLESFGVVV